MKLMLRVQPAALLGALLLGQCLGLAQSSVVSPQPPPASAPAPRSDADTNDSTELLDGLMELLNQPESATNPAAEPGQPTPTDNDSGPHLPQLSTNDPLAAIQQSMRIAAARLKSGDTSQQTQQLQTDIVLRLDELIEQLQNSEPPSRSPREQSSNTDQTVSRQQDQQRQAASSADNSAQAASPTPPEAGRPDPAGSSRQGQPDEQSAVAGGSIAVPSLADPRALQQSVWGQLPERIREQMQSRMVEDFLPSYRDEIKAYFQALMK